MMRKFILAFYLLSMFSVCSIYGQYQITNTADSGPGSLRQAIINANNDNTGGGIISMTSGTIYLSSPLPEITVNNLSIDGSWITLDGQWNIQGPPITINECLAPNSIYEHFDAIQNFLYSPSIFYVTNTNDCGSGSLRRIINTANIAEFGATIRFNIPGTPPHVISVNTPLPTIKYGVTIDGTTQPDNGYTGSAPKIELRGSGSGAGLRFNGADGFKVYGLQITNFDYGIFSGGWLAGTYDTVCSNYIIGSITKRNIICDNVYGIYIDGYVSGVSSGGAIIGNFIGTSVNGDTAKRNDFGLHLYGESMIIEDNVISGNGSAFDLCNIDYLTFKGNKVGVDKTGTFAIQNDNVGGFYTNNSLFGGSATGDGNIISGNYGSGLFISGNNNTFQGNYVGTDITGSYAIPNNTGLPVNNSRAVVIGGNNLLIGGQLFSEGNIISGNHGLGLSLGSTSGSRVEGNIIGLDATGTYAIANYIGLALDFDSEDIIVGSNNINNRNIISGNTSKGLVTLFRCKDISIINNYIGTNINGTASVPNGTGIQLDDPRGVTVGDINKGNLISGNSTGIWVSIANNTICAADIIANKIGTDISGTGDLGNNTGIEITFSDTLVTIGGDDINKKNIIAYNNYGVLLTSSKKCMIRKNSIFNNDNKGIDLRYNTGNESNNGYPPPIIEFCDFSSISGISEPNAIIDLYYNHTGNSTPQGKTYIGTTNADTSGIWSYSGSFSSPCITVTATDPILLTTSEFSQTAPILSEIIPDSIGLCTGDSTYIGITYNYLYSCLWSDSSTSDTVLISTPGLYWVQITDNCGKTKYDSLIVYEIISNNNIFTTGDTSICSGDSITINGYNAVSYDWNSGYSYNSSLTVYPTTNQDYILNAIDSAGCPFSDTVHVFVNPSYNISNVYDICTGDSIFFEGNYYSQDTTAIVSYSTIHGCDSILQMDLTVNPSYSQSSTFTICDNDSIFWEGNYYNTSGTFYENYVSSHGCDSILELDLTVNPAYYQLSIDTICENDSLFWEGSYCYSDSLYTLIYPLSSGCDSILELDLTVVPNPANITITGANTVSLHQSEIYAVLPNTYYYNWAVEKGTIIQQYSVNMAKIQWDSIGLGHIFIIAENQLGCLSDTIVYDVLIGTTNVENISDNDGLIIYPNPTSGEIIIETDGFIEVEIYNRIGQIILKSDKKNLNLQEFSSGVYFVKVLTDKGVKTAIVVKEQ